MRTPPRAATLVAALCLSVAVAGPAAAIDPVAPSTATSPTGTAADDATVLVGFDADADPALVHALADVGEVATELDAIDVHVVAVAPGTVDAAIAVYEALPGVAFAEPNYELALVDEHPNDPLFPQQYQLDHMKALPGFALYNDAVGAPAYAPTGGARLAILDSGIDLLHPEFAGKVIDCASYLTATGTRVSGMCQDANFHGTYVAGIAAAIADNAQGIAGVAFDAELLVYQVCTYVCFTADSAAAMIDAADNGAQVSNYSFGGPSPSATGRRAVEYAHAAGVLQVASAGNSGCDNGANSTVGFPAAYPEVVAVAATDRTRSRASYSSCGPEVDVTAPGSQILSTMPGGTYSDRFSGTSFSGPAVAGLGALLVNLGLDHLAAREAIVAGADPGAVVNYNPHHHGAGMADITASIQIATTGGGGQDEETRGNRGRGQGPPPGRGPNR